MHNANANSPSLESLWLVTARPQKPHFRRAPVAGEGLGPSLALPAVPALCLLAALRA